MVWSTAHDEMLCREIRVIDPFTRTRNSTMARGTKWEEVAENLNQIKQIYFKVDKRAVRDRYNLLSKELRKKLKREKEESGVETDMTEVEMALEELIEKEDTEQRVVDNQKKATDSQDRENAENIQKKAMERLGQTQNRKADENESKGKRRKKRSSGSDTLSFLGEKNEQAQEMQKRGVGVEETAGRG